MIAQGDAVHIPLADKSVHCVVTSPPYWGLRKYAGDQGRIWSGDPECEHEWGAEIPLKGQSNWDKFDDYNTDGKPRVGKGKQHAGKDGTHGQWCHLCGAWYGSLGLEPIPERHIENIVEICREVRRLLRDDGVFWLNYGDCYASTNAKRPTESDVEKEWSREHEAGGGDDRGRYPSRRSGQDRAVMNIDIPQGSLMLMPHRVALALQQDGWIVRQDLVWCLSGGAFVYVKVQKGEMPMMVRDLIRLDPTTIKLWNGKKWTQVLGFSEAPRPKRPLEIVLKSGERIGCTPDHQWPTERGLLNASELQPGDVLQKTTIPEPKDPTTPRHIPDQFGWVVGLYLAEGSRSGPTLQFSGHVKEEERFARLQDWAESYGGTARRYVNGNTAHVHIDSHPMRSAIDLYIAGRIAKDKHLTTAAWQRSNTFLNNLLAGYLEGDGHYDAPNDRYRLGFTNNDYLAQDLRTLCARLGLFLRLVRTFHKGFGRRFPGWHADLRYSRPDHWNARVDEEVAAIEKSRARHFYDIGVAEEPHVFALASGILTHNSKPNPMPESISGTRWIKHRIKIMRSKHATDHNIKGGTQKMLEDASIHQGIDEDWVPEYTDCPGCEKCIPNDGLVLKRGSWRHTRAHECVFMLTKKMGYWSNQEAVRETLTVEPHAPGNRSTGRLKDTGHVDEPNRIWAPSGRNPRSVLDIPTAPYKGAHYATFPPNLIAPLIRATCPRWACPVCGQGWAAVVDQRTEKNSWGPRDQGYIGSGADYPEDGRAGDVTSNVLGYRPTCSHQHTQGEAVPGIVFDPFVGSGTTVAVAQQLLRRGIGIDISMEYLDQQAKVRAGLGIPSNALDDLPLFSNNIPAPPLNKQDSLGKRTYTGFNARWKEQHE